MRLKRVMLGLAVAASLAWVTYGAAHMVKEEEGEEFAPTGRGWGERRGPEHRKGAPPKATVKGAGIDYHGGPLLVNGSNVYLIWYGNWSGNTAQSIIPDFIHSLGGSPWFNINTTYYNASHAHVRNAVTYAGQAFDSYSRGTRLSDADILQIVAAQAPTDPNGVYFVLTSADVKETSGFCTQYCGWHDNASINHYDIKYAFVGDPAQCPRACTEGTPPPNGNAGADGMVSIIAHELAEATTDPDLNAWYDRRGNENADKCAWTFGTTHSNGAGTYNVTLGSRNFLIQQNWVNAGNGYCSMRYP
jgi:hypothetical protein